VEHLRGTKARGVGRLEKYAKLIPAWIFHRNVQTLLDALTAAIAMIDAYALRFDFDIPPKMQHSMWIWLCVLTFLRPLSLRLTRSGYQSTWRFFNVGDGLRLALRSVPVTIFLLLMRWLVPGIPVVPYSVLIMEFIIFLGFASGLRVTRRLAHEAIYKAAPRPRALIVGNETTLATSVGYLRSWREAQVIGLVSEDNRLIGIHIAGLPVLGHPESLPSLLAAHQIEVVVLSGANLKCAAQVIRDATRFDLQVHILPSGSDLMQGNVRVSRTVSIDQLAQANSESIGETHPAVHSCFNGRTVLVTGAGGSIGSEIARQIAALNVDRIVVLDQDENSIFELMHQIESR